MRNGNTTQRTAAAAILGAAFWLTLSSGNAATLVFNNFNGSSGDDTGPAFQQVKNTSGVVDGASNPSTGVVTTSPDNAQSSAGFHTTSAVNLTTADPTATGFRIDWVVESAAFVSTDTSTNAAGTINANGFFFGVSDSTSGTNGTLFNNANNAIGFTILSENWTSMALYQRTGGGTASTGTAGTIPTVASINDGFTFSLTFNSNGNWSAFTTGLSDNINTSGTASTTLYNNLATSLVPNTSVQGQDITYTVDSVTLTSVPEPSAAVLIAVFATCGLAGRRRS